MNRRIAGRIAKKSGEVFENILKSTAYRQGFYPIQIPTGCKTIGPGKIIRVRTAFDFIFVKKDLTLFIDAKSVKAKAYSTSMITPHQVVELKECEQAGFTSGYIVYFQTSDQVVFFSASQLKAQFFKTSLKPEDGVILGRLTSFDLNLLKTP